MTSPVRKNEDLEITTFENPIEKTSKNVKMMISPSLSSIYRIELPAVIAERKTGNHKTQLAYYREEQEQK